MSFMKIGLVRSHTSRKEVTKFIPTLPTVLDRFWSYSIEINIQFRENRCSESHILLLKNE
jgi:hypothetical protein